MIAVGSKLRSIDNSGARIVECIKILGGKNKKNGKVGDIIIVSVKTINPLKKIKKGDVLRGVIVSVKKGKIRYNGDMVVFNVNSVVIVNNKGIPVGTRILGPVMLELRARKFMKILSMATVAI